VRRRTIIVLGSAVAVLAVGLGVAFAFGFIGGVRTPDLKGTSREQATELLRAAGLTVGGVVYDEKAVGAEGAVVAQSPAPGWRSNSGGKVDITVAGAEGVVVPDLVGKSESDGTVAITNGRLKPGRVERAFVATSTAGLIVSQSVAAGEEARLGTRIDLVVSSGPIPSVVGLAEASATDLLERAGLAVAVSRAGSNSIPAGSVVSQMPTSSDRAQAGSTIALVVSSGPSLVTVPDASKFSSEDRIKRAIQAAGLKAQVKYISPEDPALDNWPGSQINGAIVFAQRPSPGSKVAAGTTVVVTVVAYDY
jgi:beta-lactam-binding protein with PASTA domain